jgi:hypothetical protein
VTTAPQESPGETTLTPEEKSLILQVSFASKILQIPPGFDDQVYQSLCKLLQQKLPNLRHTDLAKCLWDQSGGTGNLSQAYLRLKQQLKGQSIGSPNISASKGIKDEIEKNKNDKL